jgi:hypothetical protein
MVLDDIMRLSPCEFYALYGRNAELYSERLRNDSALPVYGYGIEKCTDSLMAEPLWRYRMIYLSHLYTESGGGVYGPGITKPLYPQWPTYIDPVVLPEGYLTSDTNAIGVLITEEDNIIIKE